MKSDLKFGVEWERILVTESGEVIGLKEADELFSRLKGWGFTAEEVSDDRILILSKEIGFSKLIIKNESVAHIIELIFPPMDHMEDFGEAIEEVLRALEETMTDLGMRFFDFGILPEIPIDFAIRVDEESSQRVKLTMDGWEVPDHKLAVPEFWFASASTHIHLQIEPEKAVRELTRLYGLEYRVIERFANSPSFLGQEAHCIRPLAYHHNFLSSYLLAGFPDSPVRDMEEYLELRRSTPAYIRDYSFIALRDELGTLEFRSTDSLNTPREIVDLVQFRLDQWESMGEGLNWEESRNRFFEACWKGGN